jgi:hypothetical protein
MQLLTIGSGARLTLLAAAACLCLCGGSAGAGAQTMAQPGKAAPTSAPAMQPAPPPMGSQDDPAKVAAARQFLMVYRPQSDPKQLSKMLDQAMPQMIAQAKAQNPKLDAKKFADERRAAILAQAARLLDLQSHVVSRHFTLPELQQLTATFGSPLVRKLQAEGPKIQREIMLTRPLNMGPPGPPSGPVQMKVAPPPANPPAHK